MFTNKKQYDGQTKNVFGTLYCKIVPYIFLINTEGNVNWTLTFIGTFNLQIAIPSDL